MGSKTEGEPEPEPSQLVSIETREEQRIADRVRKWQNILLLGRMSISNVFDDSDYDSDNDDRAAEAEVLWQYDEATIRWWTKGTIEYSDNELDELVLHELSHVILGPLDKFIPGDEDWLSERTATDMQKALYSVFKHASGVDVSEITQEDQPALFSESEQIA